MYNGDNTAWQIGTTGLDPQKISNTHRCPVEGCWELVTIETEKDYFHSTRSVMRASNLLIPGRSSLVV